MATKRAQPHPYSSVTYEALQGLERDMREWCAMLARNARTEAEAVKRGAALESAALSAKLEEVLKWAGQRIDEVDGRIETEAAWAGREVGTLAESVEWVILHPWRARWRMFWSGRPLLEVGYDATRSDADR